MKKKTWEVQYLSLPPVIKHCKKCGTNMEFICSMQFRINAQRRSLDIWLIYKCSDCDTTWNATIYSRISPQSLNPALLDGFYRNDKNLVEQYAMNRNFLHGNGVEVGLPQYSIIGDSFLFDEDIELEIKSKYSFPIKISSLVREKLNLSQKEYSQLIDSGTLKSIPNQDLKKGRLKKDIVLFFNKKEHTPES